MKPFIKIYPIGFCDAPIHNDGICIPRIRKKFLSGALICKNLGLVLSFSIQSLNRIITDMILEIFDQSTAVSAQMTISALSVKDLHAHQINIILDGVFNHVGRGFWAFQDVLEKENGILRTKDWFHISFDETLL